MCDRRGFSLVELVVVVALIMILSAFAVPQVMNNIRSYQLTSAASQVADAIKFTRSEAIRRNVNVACLASASGSTWMVGTDSNGDGTLETSERHFQMTGMTQFLPSSDVATAGSLPTALNVPAVTVLSASSSTQKISFDPRGAVNFAGSAGGATTVYVLYVGPTGTTQDYRAVVVMPSGQTQVWGTTGQSTWHQIS
jgi:prepilin-type N-terminal cleavage/methylation domain-containing protein